MDNRLKVIEVKNSPPNYVPAINKKILREEIQAKMDRLWLDNPLQFDPERDCIQRQRIKTTIELIKETCFLNDKKVADLGCGSGLLSRLMRDAGAYIDAVDVASNALQHLKAHDMRNITPIHECLPTTRLLDNAYDIVVCTEVIGYLNAPDFRLFFAELARVVKAEGVVICSSELDINTEDPLHIFASLAETEFNIDQWVVNHHMLFIRLCGFFEIPSHYLEAYHHSSVRSKELNTKGAFGRFWFKMNTSIPTIGVWKLVNFIASPIARVLRQSSSIMNLLEKLCRFLFSESGISHAIFVGKRRPLSYPLPKKDMPKEMKHKRQVWE